MIALPDRAASPARIGGVAGDGAAAGSDGVAAGGLPGHVGGLEASLTASVQRLRDALTTAGTDCQAWFVQQWTRFVRKLLGGFPRTRRSLARRRR